MLEQLLESLGAIRESATVERVFGKAVKMGKKTVIPVAEIRMVGGLGFGRPPPEEEEAEEGVPEEEADEGPKAEGGGGGGHLSARPVAVIEVTEEETTVIPIVDVGADRARVVACLGLGLLAGLLLGALTRHRE